MANLSSPAKAAANVVGNGVARTVTMVLPEQFDHFKKGSRKREAEIEADLRIFRHRVQKLEMQIAVKVKDASYATQEEKIYNLVEQLTAIETIVTDLNTKIAQLKRDIDFGSRFVETVGELLSANAVSDFNSNQEPPA